MGLVWQVSHYLDIVFLFTLIISLTSSQIAYISPETLVCFMPSCPCICFCFSLEFTFLIYLLSKFILQKFSENCPLEAFLGHLRQLNVSSSDLPLGDNFYFMAGQHLVQFLLIIPSCVFWGDSSTGHTHWSINLGAIPYLAKWQRCNPG